jgi:hypothetical protein
MSIKDFVQRTKITSKENIHRAYEDIDLLYWEINLLNDQLNRYSNKTSGRTLSVYERQDEMAYIRERIYNIYKDINFYKECINFEKKEITRINETYGFNSSYESYFNNNNQYYDDELDEVSLFEDNDLEEIKDYKYNPVTDTWE